MGKSKIQRLLNKIDKANCDPDCDMQEYEECCTELGREMYRKSLQKDGTEIRLKNPRKDRNHGE
jgi:hypothetical protein